MKLISYRCEGQSYVGALSRDGAAVLPLPYPDMNALIDAAVPPGSIPQTASPIPITAVELLAPIPRPRQDVICLGVNYRSHADEALAYSADSFDQTKTVPIYFSKRVYEAVPPEGFIESHPGLVRNLDYEAELAVIIGKTARNVKAADAADYIFGYTILNDVSARVLQTEHQQWFFGKSLDGFTPMGPCIVTADEISFPPVLDISCSVNGELRQHSSTGLLLTGVARIVEELSSGMTLLPGTIIATGTPSGVGLGFHPPKFLQSGDVVACTIEGIGTLRNTVR